MDNFEEVVRSPEFHFLIGPDRTKLTVHTGVVQNLSPPLAALVNNGRTKESLSGTAVIEDVEEATFIEFCEFAYRDRYNTRPRGDEENKDDLSADGKDLQRARGPIKLPEYLTRERNRKSKSQSRRNGSHSLIILHLPGKREL